MWSIAAAAAAAIAVSSRSALTASAAIGARPTVATVASITTRPALAATLSDNDRLAVAGWRCGTGLTARGRPRGDRGGVDDGTTRTALFTTGLDDPHAGGRGALDGIRRRRRSTTPSQRAALQERRIDAAAGIHRSR